jgi:hypothetical protein
MSNTARWVTDARTRGGRVLVETLDYKPSAKKQKAKQEEAFALVPLARAAEVTKCTKTQGAMVWIVLAYLAWKNKSPTVTLSNETMRQYGVNRHVKYRALATLEAAGIVTIKWRNKQSPIVTLIQ